MTNKRISLLLSAALLSSTLACKKAPEQASQTAPSAQSSSGAANISPSSSNSTQAKSATVPAGTTFNADLQQDLSTGKNRDQDRFTLRVNNGLFGGNPTLKNAEIQGHLENVVKAARGKKATLKLVFDDITLKNKSSYPLDVTLVNTQVESKTKGKFLQNVGIILGGAAAGHFLGDKAKFKHGGLAGGAAAAAFVLSSPGGEVVLKKGTDLKLKLKSALATN
ncbi:MAG: hypothetical protein WCA35_15295 [Kovacikia sp.]